MPPIYISQMKHYSDLEVVSGVFESFHFEPEGIVHNENLSMESIFYHICVNSGLLTYH